MATNLENIATIKSNSLALLAEITASPKPSYSENGRSFSWTEYQRFLMQQVTWCDAQLNANEPFEVVSYGVPE